VSIDVASDLAGTLQINMDYDTVQCAVDASTYQPKHAILSSNPRVQVSDIRLDSLPRNSLHDFICLSFRG